MRGLRFAAVMQTVLVLAMVGAGLLLFLGAFSRGSLENPGPLFPEGLSGFSAVLMMVPFLFVGFDVIPQAAEELRIPRRSIGALLLTAVALAALWYAVVAASVALSLPAEGRAAASLATADAMGALWGPEARALLVLAGLGGILSSWNAFMIGGSRAIYAMALAGQLPAVFARRHPRYQTPTAALALLGGLSACAPFFGRPALVWLVDAGGLGITVAYAWVAAAFLALRLREPELPRPFRLPGGRLFGYGALLASLGLSLLYLPFGPAALSWPAEWAIVLGWAGLGAGLYGLARRPS
jgi:amino acid transporter